MSELLSGELFAGYGGLALAIERVFGARTAWVADLCGDPAKGRDHKEPHGAPCTILSSRFPDAPNLGNVTQVAWHKVPRVDVMGGGSPCQDLSHAGKRAGMKDGTRSGLWASMCDAIEIIRPRFVVWENVRGALSAEATAGDVESCEFCVGDPGEPPLRALGRVLGDLAELGYDAAWCGLRAADVGAPHGRFRVFVLAWDAAAEPADVGHERSRPAWDGRPGPANRGDRTAEVTLLPTPAVNDMGAGKGLEAWDAWTDRMKAAHGNGNGHGRSLDVEARRLNVERAGSLLPTPTATDHKASGATYTPTGSHHAGTTLTDATVRQPEAFGQYTAAVGRWETILGRPAPSPTEPTGKGGAARLSPRFVEWMMGLPDGWVTDTDTTRNEQLKALGNGVVPQQAEAALRHLLSVRAAALEAVAA